MSDAPASYIAGQIKGIIGIEIVITRIEGKWKVSQNRPEQDRRGVLNGLRDKRQEVENMAQLVARYGRLEEYET